MLFEAPLEKIEGLVIGREVHFQKEREEIYLQFDFKVARIHVSNTREFKETLESVGVLEKEFSIQREGVLPVGETPEKVLIA